ncbi:hypothetical protein RvY_06324-2 [Ramazzottius varieornatus]|uniref:Annexin n=1 Tax=Ramazzottius varieornatus TaxID=947166 RepID=A0A1D1V3N7_RAMVA|nr:hypothetical protein RvY_06324-2 [Ramazzottius varieornatus]
MATYVREVKQTTTSRSGLPQSHLASTRHIFEDTAQRQTSLSPSSSYTNGPPITYHRISVDPYDRDWEPAIYEYERFNPEEDAKALRKAMKGAGTDEKAIINILAKRSNRQRQQIAKAYRATQDRDLVKDLKSELSGTLEDVILGLMQPPEVYDAHTIHKAVAGVGTDEQTLIEVLGSRTAEELSWIKQAYLSEFKTDLSKDIAGDTSGFFRKLLLAKIDSSERMAADPNRGEIYPKQAYHEAQALWENGPKKWQNNEAFFIPIFTERSEEHLRQLFQDYKAIGRIDIEKDIEKELSGDVRALLLAFVRVCRNRPAYFAERLKNNLNSKTATRVIVSRAEKDLNSIKQEYQRMYGKPLELDISEHFSGDAKRVLLAILASRNAP